MLTKHSDIFVCQDCYLYLNNGDLPEDTEDWRAENVADFSPLHLVAGNSEKCEEFSSSCCDACDSDLAGFRGHMVLLEDIDITPFTPNDVETMLSAYIECALWSSIDDDDAPLDSNYDCDDLADETRAAMRDDCTHFLRSIIDAGIPADTLPNMEQIGHDFWLTRNGHGTGFWDRGLGALGDKLTELSKACGSADIYAGDDGKLYLY